jgi:signal transduction histidine kinase/ActR/RegA family two-component response regulator
MGRFRGSFLQAFQSLPLRRRLSWLIAVCAGITTLLCMLAVVGSGLWLQHNSAREETTEVARTLSFALQAPLAFNDRQGINDALTVLRARPQVEAALVFDRDGKLLASYGSVQAVQSVPRDDGFTASRLQVTETVRSESEVLGRVVVVNRLSRLWQALALAMLAIALASLAGLVFSVLLAQRIARAITQPIDTLANASREIARSHDYAQRLPDGGSDEIGTATNAFNNMLEEIRARGDALVRANSELESRVADRTASLQREKERAESASVAKTRFLANMSHELRTPLNAVIGASQLLQDGQDDAEGQALLVSAIRDSGTKLLGLIDNILDLARIETGAFELVGADFHLVDCVESAVSTASVAARIKGLEMACIVDPLLAAWRHGDATRLRQILLNLLGNAVKFTLEGEVVLRIEPGAAADTLHISVSDTGIGIGAASLKQVFEPFRQADDASNRRFGGSGLGLAISRQLVEAMGGSISVQSTLGQGSRFDVHLVLPPSAQPMPAPQPLRHTIVYFEPHEPSAQALAAQLQRLGCTAYRCTTPRDLRQWMARHAGDAEQPWLLAAVDATETWGFLEASINWLDPERVIGMGRSESHAIDAARERFNVPRNIVKPVLRSALVSRLGAGTGAPARPAAPAASAPTPRPGQASAKHVLVVEDDRTNQMIVCGMLHNAGYRTTTADNGSAALELLAHRVFDVVLMDWQMPDLDGLEVTRRLRTGAAGRFATVVPIIGLTANAFSEDRVKCLAAGMNDFLTKPVLAKNLIDTVARWTTRPGGDEESVRNSAFGPLY